MPIETDLSALAGKAALDAAVAALAQGDGGVLGLVLALEGHGYAMAGTLLHVAADGRRTGWFSPGCSEAQIEAAAAGCRASGRGVLLQLDNRDVSDVFGGGAGCRGRQTAVLLPLQGLPGIDSLLAGYRSGAAPLELSVSAAGHLCIACGAMRAAWRLVLDQPGSAFAADAAAWRLRLAPLPRVLVCGAGPESPLLLRLLDELGWRIDLFESRPAWQALATPVEARLSALPRGEAGSCYRAALVMAHHFDYDREALLALAGWPRLPWVGLLGPRQRRQDLMATLPPAARVALDGRLESPAGIELGGRGPAAIALSLAARLQQLACPPAPH